MALAVAGFGVTFAVALLCSQSNPTPQFRSATDLIRIEVTALDKARHAVRGLTATDFSLLVDGQPRQIEVFAAVDVPLPRAVSNAAPWLRDVAPDVATNTAPDEGRLVVILFDRSIPPGPKLLMARRIAAAAVDALGPHDVAAVTSVWPGAAQGFTTDRARLLRAIQTAAPGSASTDDARASDSRIFASTPEALAQFDAHEACFCNVCVLDRIREIAETVRTTARPKLLLFIGTQLTMTAGDVSPTDPTSRTAAECSGPLKDAREAMSRALDQSGVTIHSFDPSGLETQANTARAGVQPSREELQARQRQFLTRQQLFVLPELTGGRVVVDTNTPQEFVSDALAESASYYVIGFRGLAVGRNPARVEVKSSRRGVTVHAQRSVASVTPAQANPPGPVAAAVERVLPDRSLPLTLQALPMALSGNAGPSVVVVLGLPARGSRPVSDGGGRAEILFTALDPRGRTSANDVRAIEIAGAGPANVVSSLAVAPGSYEIRAGAALPDGRVGSVSTYVDVPDFRRDAVSLSGIILEADQTDPTAVVSPVADLLPVTPTTRRDFRTTDAVKVFFRIYQGSSDGLQPVRIDVVIADAAGQIAFSRSDTLEAIRFQEHSSPYGLQLPAASLRSGVYLLRIGATLGERHTTKDVRFEIR